MNVADAAGLANDWLALFPTMSPSASPVGSALAAAVARANYWHALLIATAADGGCTVILIDDMADGSVLDGVRVVNPFDGVGLSASARLLLSTP